MRWGNLGRHIAYPWTRRECPCLSACLNAAFRYLNSVAQAYGRARQQARRKVALQKSSQNGSSCCLQRIFHTVHHSGVGNSFETDKDAACGLFSDSFTSSSTISRVCRHAMVRRNGQNRINASSDLGQKRAGGCDPSNSPYLQD